jgi:hypothetical protein
VCAAVLAGGCAPEVDECPTRRLEGDMMPTSSDDLSALDGVTELGGSLIIDSVPDVFRIEFECLEHIEGELVVRGAVELEELSLPRVSMIDLPVEIHDNPQLREIAIPELKEAHTLHVTANALLEASPDLRSLRRVDQALGVHQNPVLRSLDGLGEVEEIGGSLGVSGNDALTSLLGLGRLAAVGHNLSIRENPALEGVDGLESLVSVGLEHLDLQTEDGVLWIEYNDKLANLDGLNPNVRGSLEWVHVLRVRFNDALTECAIEDLAMAIQTELGWDGYGAPCPDGQACAGPVCAPAGE